jgi:hypothetical protein
MVTPIEGHDMTQRATFMVCLAFSSMVHGAAGAARVSRPGSLDGIDGHLSEFEKNSGHKLNNRRQPERGISPSILVKRSTS